MFALGIVGHAAKKFVRYYGDGVVDTTSTSLWQKRAREVIRELIIRHDPQWVISGRSPLGGVDIWAIEEAQRLGVKTFEFAPRHYSWGGPGGYRERNLQIAKKSTHVAVVVLASLPDNFPGLSFAECYHCAGQTDDPGPHVKSGGCWTARRCKSREWVIL